MESQLSALIKQRGFTKSKLTRYRKYLDNLDNANYDVHELESRYEHFKCLYNEFDDIQSKISIIDDSDDFENREMFENAYHSAVSITKRLIGQDSRSTPAATKNVMEVQTRLPEIKLPAFDGRFNEWLSFHDTFNSLVHSNIALSDINKFQYLKASLKGEASRVIQPIAMTDENYLIAWAKLVERYEDRESIVIKHIQNLFDLTVLTRESHSLLRQLVDDISINLEAIVTIEKEDNLKDRLLIHLFSTKLDHKTKRDWERDIAKIKAPTLSYFLGFLTERAKLLEKISNEKPHQNDYKVNRNQHSGIKKGERIGTFNYHAAQRAACAYCKRPHYIYSCQSFLKLPVSVRVSKAKSLGLCLNCLRVGHTDRDCGSEKLCRICQKTHHTMLHEATAETRTSEENIQSAPTTSTTNLHCGYQSLSSSLLATVTVIVFDRDGNKTQCRGILDSGSQSHFISENLYNALKLPVAKTNIPVFGINNTTTKCHYSCQLKIKSNVTQFSSNISCLIVSHISDQMPSDQLDISHLTLPSNVRLADPTFHTPGKIDLLIGSTLFWDSLQDGKIKINNSNITLYNTQFGWIVAGDYKPVMTRVSSYLSINEKICKQLTKFWELDTFIDAKTRFSREEQICNEHFAHTVKRDHIGRFEVNIPFKQNLIELGDNFHNSLRRFYLLERKFIKDVTLRDAYVEFMTEYENLGHMTEIKNDDTNGYYLPHHAVFKDDNMTRKIRVVFDGSCKSASGLSLNDVQLTGPALQNDLFEILLRFRQYRFVMKADIAKMYRQILVDPDQRRYQKILWRPDSSLPIKSYQLNTVTYGTASAPFLAIRSLIQLANDNEVDSPLISKIIKRDFYVDDLITGADDITYLVECKKELISLLATAQFELRKWVSNNDKISDNVYENSTTSTPLISESNESKTLGVVWDNRRDQLEYRIRVNPNKKLTKREVLSQIAQIFDPLGLIGPVVIKAKIFLQKLWQLKVNWDDAIQEEYISDWLEFLRKLGDLNKMSIPRYVLGINVQHIELHGFCDASEVAYGACIYLKAVQFQVNVNVNLLCAKSRVAPLKSITLPRLELCGALLLARLVKKVKQCLTIGISKEYYWTDSTIVLSWISGSPVRWKQFVAHRVSEIQELTTVSNWHHVRTHENPADIISRGLYPAQLSSADLWWHGPPFLEMPQSSWPTTEIKLTEQLPEQKVISSFFTTSSNITEFDLISKFSCFNKLRRTTAYILRFINNCKFRKGSEQRIYNNSLSPSELTVAERTLTKLTQKIEFSREIHELLTNNQVSHTSKLLPLTPFLDKYNIIRVGGRIGKSNYAFDQKHPAVLPGTHHFTKLLIKYEHGRLLHAGATATLASIRCKYWPLSGRSTVRHVLRKCYKCFRANPRSTFPRMGDLPSYRLTPSRPFIQSGVDYAGPFLVKEGIHNKRLRAVKVYVAIFVCMVVKAIHIEVVSDLTTEAFLAALRRFIARRGMVSDIYSDNANNFVGANNHLRNIEQLFKTEIDGNRVISSLSNQGITWHFIPPRAPHFGGLWEASVKSIKNHLKRVIGDAKLTFEEFSTILTQIEAVLNSRPLSPMSNDPHDLSYLTPGHFLIGETLTAPIDPDITHLPNNRLSRWQYLQRLQQHFWTRWSKEYVSSLQQRFKWKVNSASEVTKGALVLVKEDNLPPLRWSLGRIVDIHPGKDNIIRVVSVKTTNNIIKRAVSRICVLPTESNGDT